MAFSLLLCLLVILAVAVVGVLVHIHNNKLNSTPVSAEQTSTPQITHTAQASTPATTAQASTPATTSQTNVPTITPQTNTPTITSQTNVPTITSQTNTPQITNSPPGNVQFSNLHTEDNSYMKLCNDNSDCKNPFTCKTRDDRDDFSEQLEIDYAKEINAKETTGRLLADRADIQKQKRCRCTGSTIYNPEQNHCSDMKGNTCEIFQDTYTSQNKPYINQGVNVIRSYNSCNFIANKNISDKYRHSSGTSSKLACIDSKIKKPYVQVSMHEVSQPSTEYEANCTYTPTTNDVGRKIKFDSITKLGKIEGAEKTGLGVYVLALDQRQVPNPVDGTIIKVEFKHPRDYVTIQAGDGSEAVYIVGYFCDRTCIDAPEKWCAKGPWNDGISECTYGCFGDGIWQENMQTCWCPHGPYEYHEDRKEMVCTANCGHDSKWDQKTQKCTCDQGQYSERRKACLSNNQ